MESRSLKLAQELAKDAQKAAKGSWFSKPEWDIAAQFWSKAAASYKTALHYEEAIDCFTKASEGYVHTNTNFLAAKCIEDAASLAEKQLKNQAMAISLYCRASDRYRAHGSSPDKAAEMMEKAAKLSENVDTEKSIQLYDQALSIYETEDRGRFGIETFKRVTRFLIDKGRLSEAVEIQTRLAAVCEQINSRPELTKTRMCIIILLLAFGDNVEAGKKLDEFGQDMSFARSNEAEISDYMIQAYNNGDQDMFSDLCRDQTMGFIESSVARLALKIRVPGAKRVAPSPAGAQQPPSQSPAYGAPAPVINAYDAGPSHQPEAEIGDEDDDLL
ncbi:hypothetical protein LPJ53_003453 [Coemansia erecta]|uniref:Gamma-soluble NSF attachment protein n=1 Tax=Coemansia erecta TaxID=147472 RepID=A0A9W7XW74_9FUNG|nr:hypothetical protein LPJ53_003453 [Coemansia erecta]